MLSIAEQIAQGRLVCPVTHLPLKTRDGEVTTRDGTRRYPYPGGVPILLADPGTRRSYEREADGAMHAEYLRPARRPRVLAALDRLSAAQGDLRNPAAVDAFEATIADQPASALCVAIGGGPTRAHPNLVNLNLDAFDEVDVVGDAYRLPYATGSVDALHCEAVLEHLEHPRRAVAEMFRVLKPGGRLFAATPFLQAFHAYPNHYQNFTLEGQNRLFLRAGFELLAAGACVGPTFALTDLAALYCRSYLPGRVFSRAIHRLVVLLSLLVRPIDRRLHRTPRAHLLASSVYAHLLRP